MCIFRLFGGISANISNIYDTEQSKTGKWHLKPEFLFVNGNTKRKKELQTARLEILVKLEQFSKRENRLIRNKNTRYKPKERFRYRINCVQLKIDY